MAGQKLRTAECSLVAAVLQHVAVTVEWSLLLQQASAGPVKWCLLLQLLLLSSPQLLPDSCEL